ncbi:MAG: NAD-dependent epimerase/dehydratase family protein [Betaproteobacteria bacterium]
MALNPGPRNGYRVLVTGARGFIGRRCLPLLAARGYEVHAVSAAEAPSDPAWHRCDLLDPVQRDSLLARVEPSHLLHLAWITKPGVFWHSPDNARWLEASVGLVERFYAVGGKRVLGVGSCAEYAASEDPCDEARTPIAPVIPYGKAKAAMQEALRASGYDDWAWARVFFPYGPGDAPGRFIPDLIDSLLSRRSFDCTHGTQIRDFIFIDDVAEACVALLDSDCSGAYNVGSGRGTTLRELAAAAVAQLGHAELIRFGARPPPAHDAARVVANVARIGRDLRWSPRIDIEEGLRRCIAARKDRT